jgi:hypothetical protein
MTFRGAGFWGYRWENYEHRELYDMVTTGKGAAVVAPAQDAWSGFTKLMNESRDRIDRLQREAGVSWEGQAAGSMNESVSPLTAWAQESATAGEQTNSSLRQIADGFTHAANTMPEPVVVPSKMSQGLPTDFTGVLAGQTDEDTTDQRAQQAHRQAIELMSGYTANNVDSADTAGTFSDPPEVGITAARPTDPGGSADGVIDGPSGGEGPGGPGGSGGPDTGSGEPRQSGPGDTGGSGQAAPAPRPGGTDPSQVAPSAGPVPVGGPSAGGSPGTAPTNPFAPITGVLTDPTTGRTPGGVSGRGGPFGGGPGRGGVFGGGPGGSASGPGGPGSGSGGSGGSGGAPGRGGMVGGGPGAAENAAPVRGTQPGGARAGGAGAGMAPLGAGAGRGEEDKERNSAEYLRDYNDEFWDDTPPVAPPVIGVDDDD